MHKFTNSLISRLYSSWNVFLSGTLIFGLFNFPLLTPVTNQTAISVVKKVPVTEQLLSVPVLPSNTPLAEAFFGKEILDNVANSLIREKMNYVSTRPAYPASLAVIKKHANTIRRIAAEKNVPEDVAIGVALLENGGSETAVSKAGALGVFQLMPGTARSLGLTVNKKLDERKDPGQNIEAGISYLRANFERFGDWGLATWAYHAGEGNVSKAIQLYAREHGGVKLPGVNHSDTLKQYVMNNNITVHKLLSSTAVKTLTKKLNDDSAGYPYKVLATAQLFRDASNKTSVVPGTISKVTNRNLGK